MWAAASEEELYRSAVATNLRAIATEAKRRSERLQAERATLLDDDYAGAMSVTLLIITWTLLIGR